MTALLGWRAYSAQRRSNPLRHARVNPALTPGVSPYFDVTAVCGQQARIPLGSFDVAPVPWDPDHPKACPRCAKATRAQPWPVWRWNAYAWDHDTQYHAAISLALNLLAHLARSVPNPDRKAVPCP